LAARTVGAGLVDEWNSFLSPVVVGGGMKALPESTFIDLALEGERRFSNRTVYLSYRTGR
jgi:riboflavin biosynthesis pyrimidine reductase